MDDYTLSLYADEKRDCVISVDHEGRILRFDSAAEAIFGYTATEALGMPIRDALVSRFYAPADHRPVAERDTHLTGMYTESIALHASGAEFPVAVTFTHKHAANGARFTIHLQDLSEQRPVTTLPQVGDRVFQSAIEQTADAVILLSDNNTVMYASPTMTRILGYTPQVLVHRGLQGLVHPDDRPAVNARIATLLTGGLGTAITGEMRVRHREGHWLWVEVVTTNHLDDPTLRAFVVTFHDISARRQGEKEHAQLLASSQGTEEQYRALFEGVRDAIFVTDAQGNYIDANPAALTLLGYDRESLLHLQISDVMVQDREQAEAAFAAFVQAGFWQGEVDLRRKDGSIVVAEGRSVRISSPEGPIYVAVLHDNTERKAAADALKQSEARFRTMIEKSSEAIGLIDVHGWCRTAGPSTQHILGYTPEEVLGTYCLDLAHPEDRGIVQGMTETIMGKPGASATGEYRVRHKDGSWHWIEATKTNCLYDPSISAIVENYRDITERKRVEAEQQRQRRYLEALHEVTLGLINRLDVNDLLHAIIEHAGALSGTPHGFINLVAEHGDEIEFGFGHGVFNVDGIPPVRRGQGLSGIIWQTKQPLNIADYNRWSRRNAGPHLGRMHATVGVPLLRGETVLGVLGLAYEEAGRTFDDATILALTRFARLAALALDNAQLYNAVQMSERRYRMMIDTAQEGIWLFDTQGLVTFANEKMAHMLGYRVEEIVGRSFSAFMEASIYEKAFELLNGSARGEQEMFGQHDCCFIRRDGTLLWAILTSSPIYDDAGHFTGSLCMVTAITERKQAEDALRHHATHDALTDLPNRTLFFSRLDHAIQRRREDPRAHFAVLFLDLDRFKHVNDSLGHTQGDFLLITIVDRIRHILPETSLLARWGGDEFAILMENSASVVDAIQLAERLHTALSLPFTIGSSHLYVTSSIGIAGSTGMYVTPEEVLRDADTAMYRAKTRGSSHAVFNTAMHAQAVMRLQLESDLRQAIEREEFEAYYQPIMSLEGEQVVGMEALIRWQHPQRGLIYPSEFIPIAEETKTVVALNRWMLRTACRQMHAWGQMFPAMAAVSVSVNLSARDLTEPDCIADIRAALAETGLDPQRLNLEITERALVEHAETASLLLRQLQEIGIRIHLDDFGTGYSSPWLLTQVCGGCLED